MGAYAGPNILNQDLALSLDTTNPRSYPGSGTTWFDLGPMRMHHDLVGVSALTTVDGVPCFAFTGTGTFARRGSSVSYTFPTDHTLIAWARPMSDAASINWRTLWRTSTVHPILIQDAVDTIGYWSGSFRTFNLVLSTIGRSEKWAMWTISCSGGTSTIYVDDAQFTSSVPYTAAGVTHESIGNIYTAGQNQPWGHVATTNIYNRAVSREEVMQIFNATRSKYGL